MLDATLKITINLYITIIVIKKIIKSCKNPALVATTVDLYKTAAMKYLLQFLDLTLFSLNHMFLSIILYLFGKFYSDLKHYRDT